MMISRSPAHLFLISLISPTAIPSAPHTHLFYLPVATFTSPHLTFSAASPSAVRVIPLSALFVFHSSFQFALLYLPLFVGSIGILSKYPIIGPDCVHLGPNAELMW